MEQAMEARTCTGRVWTGRAVGKAFFAFVRFLQQLGVKPALSPSYVKIVTLERRISSVMALKDKKGKWHRGTDGTPFLTLFV